MSDDSKFVERNMRDGKLSKMPKLQLALGIAISIGIAIFAYFRLATIQELEVLGGSLRMNRIESLIYDIGGAYTVFAVWLLVAVFIAWKSYSTYKVKTKK